MIMMNWNLKLAFAAAVLSISAMASTARATIVVDASVGGAPTGAIYANFDDASLPLGAGGGTSNGIAVSFTGDGQTVVGASSGVYAAPYLSNSNGMLFGDPTVSGADTTHYLTTGTGSITLDLPGLATYIGLLWGSVDNYNTLSFYNGNTLIGSITGADVTASADGNQGASGTYYANITSTDAFNRVVASSTSNAFELDNVAYNAVPEPSSFVLALFGGAGLIGCLHRRRNRLSVLNNA